MYEGTANPVASQLCRAEGQLSVKAALHKIKHLLRIQPCELVEIVHEPTCEGGCFLPERQIKQCKWSVVLRCRDCGELTILL